MDVPQTEFAVTFVRHGESTDNLKSIWAGWKDAGLSVHGFNQAEASGASHANIKIHTIFSSPLERAHTTALQVLKHQREPKPPLILTPLLREQHFGIAEGQKISYKRTTTLGNGSSEFSPLEDRTSKFPQGESAEDVAIRADNFIDEFFYPLMEDISTLRSSEDQPQARIHIYVVSHGIAISELVAAFLRRDRHADTAQSQAWRGLRNTGWTRILVGLDPTANESFSTAPSMTTVESTPSDVHSIPEENATQTGPATSAKPNIIVRITHVNQSSHLNNLKRQKGIGSSTYDQNQKPITDFFSGGSLAKSQS
ncbi:histidine phosphatase superfamily [Cantharellus anzutake]|uniref:histidine phosphatase superfamily n=1 Tax=Cantharellus anzutake TaxID=1750568 RepID=UPI001904D014|nr:histidine phosphatase superfamily [Cantharellus anzutake]KAF8333530.1 histidine phosphatase superfamily [Cantharellus anzutake]